MNIAFFQRELPSTAYNGVATQVHDLANSLIELGEKVTVFTLSAKPHDALYECVTLKLPQFVVKSKFLKRFMLGLFFALVNTDKFDLIHAHGDNFLMFGKKPVVRTFYGSAIMEFKNATTVRRKIAQALTIPLEWVGYLASSVSVIISPKTAEHLPGRHILIPCGVNRKLFYPSATKPSIPSLLYVGGLHDRKQGRLLISIFSSLKTAYPGVRLRIVGPDFISADGIECIGPVDRLTLTNLYREAWILISPSKYEGFGLPALEAMSCGTPVIATINDGSIYLLDNGKYGILCKPDELKDRILLLLFDKKKRVELSMLSMERAAELDILNTANLYKSIYAKTISY